MELAGKRILVVGMARSGLAALRLLRSKEALTMACDVFPIEKISKDVVPQILELASSYHVQAELATAGIGTLGLDLVVVSPGVPVDLPMLVDARKAGVSVIGEVELAAQYLRGPVLGVTGTNGKTTSTALAGHLLQTAKIPAQVGGNIGMPVCDMVADSHEDGWNVLELSSFQLETTTSLAAQIAVCLNVTPDHLDRHHSFDQYLKAKRRLFELQEEGGQAVLNADNPACMRFGFAGAGSAHLFTTSDDSRRAMWLEGDAIMHHGRPLLNRKDIPLPGLHNVENVMAASLGALLAGAAPDAVAEGVASFPGVEHRLEFVRELSGVRWFNDSKATNVDAALKAVASFEDPLWVVLGGRDKHSDYRPLASALRGKARKALLVGESAALIDAQIGADIPCEHCGSLDVAVATAAANASPGDVVLLAPACASFDQFRSYEHRGRYFKDLVNQLS